MSLNYAPFGDDDAKSVVMVAEPPRRKIIPPVQAPIAKDALTECNYILIIFIISMIIFTQTSV